MPTIETKDGIFLELPEGMAPDAPEVRAAVAQERNRRRNASPEHAQAQQAAFAAGKAEYDPTKDMGTGEKLLANLGAGLDSAWQGAKQLIPGVKGPTDAELLAKREADARLAEGTQLGIGADWMPSAGKVAQVTGEALPSFAVPAGPAAGVAARVLPRAIQAGFATPVRAGALTGAVAGALQPTLSNESRAGNVALGAAGGAALPGAVKAWQTGRQFLPTQAAAEGRAGKMLTRALGAEAPQVAGAAAGYRPHAFTRDIPMTLSEVSGSPAAARVELGSQGAFKEQWAPFTRSQNEETFRAVDAATADRGRLTELAEARTQATAPLREQAFSRVEASSPSWFHVPAMQAAQDVVERTAQASPAHKLGKMVLSEMDRGPTPQRLYDLRKLLADKLDGPMVPGDETAAIVKGARTEALGMMKAIDAGLDAASGGKWSQYMQRFQQESGPVTSARASHDIFETLNREGAPMVGGAPEVTRHALGRALEKHGRGTFGDRLDFGTRDALDAILGNLSQREEVMRTLKKAGTGGGGSQTAMSLADVSRMGGVTAQATPILRNVMSWLDQSTREAMVGLLQNPQAAARAIQAQLAAGKPLSAAQRAFLAVQSGAAGAAAPALMPSQ